MRFSENVKKSGLSPMRKFHPYAVAAQARGTKLYHLNIGQPDIETPPQYFEAIRTFAEPVLSYAPSPGVPQLSEAMIDYFAKFNVRLLEDDILITTGGSEALLIAMLCILNPGDEVIVPEPFYPNYSTFINAAGGVIRPVHTTAETGYHYADRARMESLINERTRAILVSTPGNPTGALLTKAEMRMIADVAKAHNLFMISDEVYREFVYGGEQLLSLAMFEDMAENAIVIDSVSKRFSACGARIGALITRNAELKQHALKFCQARLSVATIDQIGAAALYGVDDSYFSHVRDEYKRRRDTICAKLAAIPGVVCEKPKGAFYVMAKLPVDDTDAFQQWLLTDFHDERGTIMFAPGESFYVDPDDGRSEVRLAYVLNEEDLSCAMDILSEGIKQYNAR